MLYYELIITMLLQTDLEAAKSYEFLSRLLSSAMFKDEQLKKLHGQRKMKNYVFCSLYPLEADKIYKKGRAYLFKIRSLDMNLILKFKYLLPQIHAGVISADMRTFEYRPISHLKSLTPIVATIHNQSWTKKDGIKVLMERCHINALKKCRAFIDAIQEPNENFIESIQLLNDIPIKIPYKKNSFLGNKLLIGVKSDPVSQKLAFAALGAGILEKNSIGFGYCIYE